MDARTARYRRATLTYLLIALILIAAYPVSPTGTQLTIKLAASLATIPALLVGRQGVSRSRRGPWTLLVVALILINAADVIRLLPGDPATTVEQLLAAAGNLIVLFAALELIRQQGRANLGSIIDTSIAALAVGGLLWAFVLSPNLVPESQTYSAKLALFIVVFALSGVLGALAQMTIQRPLSALRPLLIALALGLTADITQAVTTNTQLTTIAAMMLIGAYTAIGLFGLDPTAQQLVAPAPARPDRLSPLRLVFLGLAVAALPIIIGVQQLGGSIRHSVLLVVSSATITTLVMLRIGQLSGQRNVAEAALRHQAAHDPLTGLPNRKEFTSQVSQELAQRNNSAIIFCDLDRFKAINDQFGHATGDRVLVEVAQRLRNSVRTQDLVSRLGGDEFVILLRNTTPHDARTINQRIVNTLARPIHADDQTTTIGVTTGTAFTDDDADADELIERADFAMYQAKTNLHGYTGT